MQKSCVRKTIFICLAALFCGWLASVTRAETFTLTNSQTVTGELSSPNAKGVIVQPEGGATADRILWEAFSQESLKAISAKSPKFAALVETFIEAPLEEEKAAAEKAAIVIRNDFEHLERPAPQPLLKALFSTGIGWVAFLLIYAANVYAGYEVSIFRARPPALVCGISAVAPFIGPIIFLCMPTKVEDKTGIVQEPMREKDAYQVEGVLPEAEAAALHLAQAEANANALPATQHFARGQFTFNRRFFETKFPGFFTMVRREADKDLMLIFKSARGEYNATRITRVGPNELHLQVQKGHASEEVMMPFLDIQEVILKHKDA